MGNRSLVSSKHYTTFMYNLFTYRNVLEYFQLPGEKPPFHHQLKQPEDTLFNLDQECDQSNG
jgi:hypothetical protein